MNFSFITLFFFYSVIIISILGYGYFVCRVVYKERYLNINPGYSGLYGIFVLIIYSYISHFFLPHGIIHNSIILIIGVLLYFFYFKYKFKKNEITLFLIIFILLFIGLLIYKTHDDFPYYHFPYTYYLTQHPLLVGVGQFNHGFRTPSSLFYLNSLFYLPFIKYYSFYIPTVLIMGFVNLILLNSISLNLKNKEINFLFFLSILSFIFINIFFYRIQEHGTDRTAQILIFLLFIKIFDYINFNHKNYDEKLNFIFVLLTLIISLKAFYLLYTIIVIPIIWILFKEKKYLLIQKIFKNYFFYNLIFVFVLLLILYLLNTGCLIYPISITCFEEFDWSISKDETILMNEHYQLWSKAGKTPNFNIENTEFYLSNFNWVSNWIKLYFFNKVSDLLLGLLFLVTIVIFIYYKKNDTKTKFSYHIFSIYLFILVLFIEWFYNHPALRYGGYILICLIFFIPTSVFLAKSNLNFEKIKKRTSFLILLTLLIFLLRNLDRIYDEIKKYDYQVFNHSFYFLDDSHFRIESMFQDLIINYNNCVEKNLSCDQDKFLKIKKIQGKKYIFIND